MRPKCGWRRGEDQSYLQRVEYLGAELDFFADRTHEGKTFRILTVIDEYSQECLAIHVQRELRRDDELAVLTELFARHGPPAHIR